MKRADEFSNDGLMVVDTTQVTSKGNYSNPKPGDLEFWIASALE